MDKPWISQIEPSLGLQEAIVFITGYCTEEHCEPYHHRHWVSNLREAGWRGSIYHLWWDSSNNRNFYSTIGQLGVGAFAHWDKHKRRARRVGEDYLENLISRQVNETTISLIGHSLGARVIFFAGSNWSTWSSHRLKNVFLLGGAIPKNRNWEKVASSLSGKVFNIYNSLDTTLRGLYRVSSFGLFPCGLMSIDSIDSRINNVDVTSLVGNSHSLERYLNTLPNLVKQGLICL